MDLKVLSPADFKWNTFLTENSQIDFVLFQSASVMRDTVIREWQLLSEEEKAGLRQYLLHYLTSRPSLTPYVQRQLVHMLALMVKRATLEAGFAGLFRSILDFVSQLLATGEVKMVRVDQHDSIKMSTD